ncbi:MAG TPA: sugar transferase [Anaerolineae bacterium]|jgi:exopolysaccharide biosynthesis polyprenyl glycosylphosphotransferase|nr:sugar transferase [Anaerolineae bacterium]
MNKKQWILFSLVNDAILINIAIIAAFLLRFAGDLPIYNFQAYTSLALFITAVQIGALYIYDLYDVEEVGDSWGIASAVVKAVTLGLILNVFLTFFGRFFSFPRPVFLIAWLVQILFLSGWRVIATRVLKIKWPVQRVLIIGHGEQAGEIISELKTRANWGYQVVGLVCNNKQHIGRTVDGARVLGTTDDLIPLVHSHSVNRVIVASPIAHREMLEELAYSSLTDVRLEVIPDLYEIYIGNVDHTLISDIPLIQLTRDPAPSWVYSLKRVSDMVGAALALLIASPAIFVAVVAIKLTSPGPVIYRQLRVGQSEKVFYIYKFRTMVADAEAKTGPVLATEGDSRITPVGRVLRKFRIDELPQLVNVLKGEMSFVGPRPERPFFVEQFKKEIPGYGERFKVKPGVTGLAQINGGYATNARNKLKYDLIYIYHQSFFLDIKIILTTLKVLLTGRGAM